MASSSVFLYVPNIIGYVRLLCIFVCWWYFEDYKVLLPVYAFQAALDGVDGTIARCLNQCSLFGAWLDVLIDNVGRTLLWTRVCQVGVFVACFEWIVFVCTHTIGMKWRDAIDTAPYWVQKVMEKGFHTLIGTYAIMGLHGLPLFLYAYYNPGVTAFLGNLSVGLVIPIILLLPARLLCAAVEGWFVYIHIKMMNEQQLPEDKDNISMENQD